jgi:transcriptional regulator with XRE-family HTH domain
MTSTDRAALKRLRLARELKRARSAARLTLQDAADALRWPVARLADLECAFAGPEEGDLEQLNDVYGGALDLAELQLLADESRVLPYADFGDVHHPVTLRYLAEESTASAIKQFEPMFVPGLLQTPQYTLSVLNGTYGFSASRSVRIADLRAQRQGALESPRSVSLECFIDEAAVSRPVGGQAVMREQLARLLDAVQNGTAVVRLVPFDGGVHPGMMGPFTYLDFGGELDDGVVYVETSATEFVVVDEPERVSAYLQAFEGLERSALSKAETVAALAARIESLT